jgi:molecular chaperone GrpE
MDSMNEEEIKIEEPIEEIEDVSFESTEEGEGEVFAKDKLRKLKDQLKDTQAEKQEYLTNWQRERADFINYKKDELARRNETSSNIKEKFLIDLLPVLDAYDMAFINKEAWEKVDKNWRVGVEYIYQQLTKTLGEHGLEEIPASEGTHFDPSLHQAIETIQTEDQSQDRTIQKTMQKGYRTKEKIIRPARVIVYEHSQKNN